MDAITKVPGPFNEPVYDYAPGSPERLELQDRLKELAAEDVELTVAVAGEHRLGGGDPISVVQPHRKTPSSARCAMQRRTMYARRSMPHWQPRRHARMSFDERAAIFLKAADLLTGPWRATLNAATMLGQSKTAYQAEIDSACEMADFWRFNVGFARQTWRSSH